MSQALYRLSKVKVEAWNARRAGDGAPDARPHTRLNVFTTSIETEPRTFYPPRNIVRVPLRDLSLATRQRPQCQRTPRQDIRRRVGSHSLVAGVAADSWTHHRSIGRRRLVAPVGHGLATQAQTVNVLVSGHVAAVAYARRGTCFRQLSWAFVDLIVLGMPFVIVVVMGDEDPVLALPGLGRLSSRGHGVEGSGVGDAVNDKVSITAQQRDSCVAYLRFSTMKVE